MLLNWLESGVNPLDETLSHFAESAKNVKSMEELKPLFEEAWRTLRGTEHQAKAKEVYDIRKSELEPENKAA